MKIIFSQLQHPDAFGETTRDGQTVLIDQRLNTEKPEIVGLVAKHEGEHARQMKEHDGRHDIALEGEAHLGVINYATQTEDGRKGLAVTPNTERGRQVQSRVRRIIELFFGTHDGGTGSHNDDVEAAWRAGEDARVEVRERRSKGIEF